MHSKLSFSTKLQACPGLPLFLQHPPACCRGGGQRKLEITLSQLRTLTARFAEPCLPRSVEAELQAPDQLPNTPLPQIISQFTPTPPLPQSPKHSPSTHPRDMNLQCVICRHQQSRGLPRVLSTHFHPYWSSQAPHCTATGISEGLLPAYRAEQNLSWGTTHRSPQNPPGSMFPHVW